MTEEIANGAPDEPRDLTQFGAPGASATSPRVDYVEKTYDPSPARENIRGRIAMMLVTTFAAVIGVIVLVGLVTAYVCSQDGVCAQTTVELRSIRAVGELVLTPLIGLVGAVTGFYYGEKSGSNAVAAAKNNE